MARVTVEDCLERVDNRFHLVHLAAKRVRQLKKGAPTFSFRDNKEIVLSLREIASGDVTNDNIEELEPKAQETIDDLEFADADDGV